MSVRRARPSFALLSTAVLLGSGMTLAACAGSGQRQHDDPPAAVDAAAPAGSTVPDLIGRDVVLVDKLAADAGLVAILSYRPQARQAPGTVVAVHPAPGSAVGRGSTIQVSVAGKPGTGLDDRIAADRRRFVGLGVDPDGTLVVAVAAGVDPAAAVAAIRPALAGRKHRVVSCDTTFAELESIRAGVSAALLRSSGFAVRVDPVTCAVRVEGDIPAEVAAELTDRYGRSVVVVRGEPARRS
jgi:hypothetical protein